MNRVREKASESSCVLGLVKTSIHASLKQPKKSRNEKNEDSYLLAGEDRANLSLLGLYPETWERHRRKHERHTPCGQREADRARHRQP